MLPEGLNVKSCEKCGNLYTKVTLESRHPIIHHGRSIKDSRNSTLNLYYLETTKCDCKEFFHGANERLVRTSSAPAQQKSNVHFVSVDLLNEYLCSLYGKSQEGKSIDAFINDKNALNSEERGDKGELSMSIFQKAVEIFIHATHYDVDSAFSCEKCPKELIGDENEDSFVDIKEVHICDGIDMGCQENSFKGFVD